MEHTWKAGFGRLALIIAAVGLLAACSSVPLRSEKSTSAISAAEAVGASSVPQAALHLQLAREQLEKARSLASRGKEELAESMLQRVVVDAELAALLATEATQKEEARAAIEQVRQLRQENKLAPVIR